MAENDKLVPVSAFSPDRLGYSGYPVTDLEPSGPEAYSFQSYWEILRKRRSTVFTVAFIATILVTVVVFRMKPVYRATARMEVQAETPALQTLNELNPECGRRRSVSPNASRSLAEQQPGLANHAGVGAGDWERGTRGWEEISGLGAPDSLAGSPRTPA